MRYIVQLLLLFLSAMAFGQPVADFTANKFSGCSPLSVQFVDQSSGTPTTYLWSFGNGNNSSLQNPSAIYVLPGTYTVSLTVSNASGNNTKTKVAFITVFNNPIANFTTSVSGGCIPLLVPFLDSSVLGNAPLNHWLWDFGDGSIATAISPQHSYTIAGAKTISLTVTDTNGCSNTVIKNNLIHVTQSHQVNFTVSNTLVCKPPSSHTLTAIVTPSNAGYTYEWSTTTGVNANTPSFNYLNTTNTGNIGVSLKVTAPNGCYAIKQLNTAIFVPDLKADFDLPSLTPWCAFDSFVFTNRAIPDTSTINYTWKINGNAAGSSKDLIKPLATGVYLIHLQSSIGACADTISKVITVNPKPTAVIQSSINELCEVPKMVQFNAQPIGAGITHQWDFGNGHVSTQQSDSTLYTLLKDYGVKLAVTNAFGCKDSVQKNIGVIQVNAIIPMRNLKQGCAPYTANFQVSNANLFTKFNWFYQGTLIDTNANFSKLFSDTGVHVVKLQAWNANGCLSELYDTVLVGYKLPVDFFSTKTYGCFNGFNPVQFNAIDSSGLPNVTFLWQWRNGVTGGRNPQVIFMDTGTYSITLSIGYLGCVNELTKPNYITILPARAVINKPLINCGSDTVFFDASLSKGKNTYWWDFGDGQSGQTSSVIHRYASFNTYQVKLVVVDTTTLCSDTVIYPIKISEAPVLTYTINDSLGCSPLLAKLHHTTVLPINSYPITQVEWSFSSGETAQGNDTSISLTAYGWRGVLLKVTDSLGCVYTHFTDSVARVSGATVRQSISPTQGCVPLLVTSTDSSITDFPVKSRHWNWGGLDTAYSESSHTSSYTFLTPNANQSTGYHVLLSITDTLGCTFTHSQHIQPSFPYPDFNVTKLTFCGGQTLTAGADTSDQSVLKPAVYKWISGNDSTSISTPQFIRTYQQADTSVVYRLLVTDANGCSAYVDSGLHVVNQKTRIGFTATPQNRDCYLPIMPVTLYDTSTVGSSGVKSRLWRVGENTSALVEPSFIFSKPGKIDVTLTLSDSAGCIDSLYIPNYIIIGGPIGNYQLQPKQGCNPLQVDFQVSSPNALYKIWDFGNGLVDTVEAENFTYTYTDDGMSVPRLTLVDSSALCAYVFDAEDTIVVFAKPQVDFDADKTFICYQTEVQFRNLTTNKPAITNWLWTVNNTDTFTSEGPLNYVFNAAGSYSISLMAIDTNGCSDTLQRYNLVDVFADQVAPEIPKSVSATVISNTQNRFVFRSIDEPDFVKYTIYYNYFAGTPISSIDFYDKLDTSFIQDNINTLANPYYYSVTATDVCGNESNKSVVHKTVELSARPLTNAVGLTWNAYEGFATIKHYEVWRNNPDSGASFTRIAVLPASKLSYTDLSAKCFTTYYYQLKTVSSVDSIYSLSDTTGASPIFISNLPSTDVFTATVINNSKVLVQWMRRDAELRFNYLIARKRDDDSVYRNYKEVSDTFLIDEDVEVNTHSYSYLVYLKDECGGISLASKEAKTILLTVDLQANELGVYNPVVYFTPYKEWVGGVKQYHVGFYFDTVSTYSAITALSSTDTSYFHRYLNLEQASYCYQVMAYQNGGDLAYSTSNIACVETTPRMYAPTAFTVNEDGINEYFTVRGVFIESFHMTIFDRWGKLVYETFDVDKPWDGKIDGKIAPSDIYVYIAQGTGRKGQLATIRGSVTLLR